MKFVKTQVQFRLLHVTNINIGTTLIITLARQLEYISIEPFITPILFKERCLPIDRYKAQFNMHKLSYVLLLRYRIDLNRITKRLRLQSVVIVWVIRLK